MMVTEASLTHMFAELSSLEDVKQPLKGSSRLRYTCLSVSRQFIAFGSNAGCVYVFNRDSLKHVKSIYGDVDASPVTVVAISPSETSLGLAVSSGQVAVVDMNIDRRSKPERIRQTLDHLGAVVTDMVWDSTGSSLFVGDSLGKITHINIPSSKAKTLFTQPSQTLVHLDSGVTQLDWWGNKLLASSLMGTYLLNTAKHQFSQIGKKPREGEFGACFFFEPSSNYPVIYCARPGSRMWEVDFEGNVLNTHQFKQLLATQPLPIVSSGVNFAEALQTEKSEAQSVNFLQIFRFGEFILTWSSRGLYVFDPINVRVVSWTDTVRGVADVCVIKNEVYILFESQEIRRLVFLPLLYLCAALVSRQRCLLAAEFLLFLEHFAVKARVLKQVKKELLPQLIGYLKEAEHIDMVDRVQAMLEDVSESSIDSDTQQSDLADSSLYPYYSSQHSGIVVVSDGSLRESPSHLAPFSFSRFHSAKSGQHSSLTKGSDAVSEGSIADSATEATCAMTDWAENTPSDGTSPQSTLNVEKHSDQTDPSGVCLDRINHNVQQVGNSQETSNGHQVPFSTLSEDSDISSEVADSRSSSHNVWAETRNGQGQNFEGQAENAPQPSVVRTGVHAELFGSCASVGQVRRLKDIQMQEERTLRKASSLPSITMEDLSSCSAVEGRKREDDLLQPVLNSLDNTASGLSSDIVNKVVKKKKQRLVNDVDIPVAGSSGTLKRSVSVGSLKQKKKKKKEREVLQFGWSLDDSADHMQDELYQQTYIDPETVSIATISSIEEEDQVISGGISSVPSHELDEVFWETGMPSKNISTRSAELEQSVAIDSEENPLSAAREAPEAGNLNGEHVEDTSTVNGLHQSGVQVNDSKSALSFSENGELQTSIQEQAPHKTVGCENAVIPTLFERLSAFGVAPVPEERGGHDSSPVKNLISEASRLKIASVKERMTKFGSDTQKKFGNTTRSLIRRVKEKNPLMARSLSESPPLSAGSVVSRLLSSKDDFEMDNILNPDDTFSTSSSSSCVDLSLLLKRTEEAQRELKSHAILLVAEKRNTVLNAWAMELNTCLLAYHRTIYLQNASNRKEESSIMMKPEISADEKEDDQASAQLQHDSLQVLGSPADDAMANSSSTEWAFPYESSILADREPDTGGTTGVSSHSSSPDQHFKFKQTDNVEQVNSNVQHQRQELGADSDFLTVQCMKLDSVSGEKSRLEDIPENASSQMLGSENHSPVPAKVSENGGDGVKLPGVKVQESEVEGQSGHDSGADLHIDWSQVCHVKDPFKLAPQQHMKLSNLLSYCLDCGCFGNAGTIFAIRTSSPKIVTANLKATEAISSSFKSFSDAEVRMPSQAEKVLYQESVFEHCVHSDGTSARLLFSNVDSRNLISKTVMPSRAKRTIQDFVIDSLSQNNLYSASAKEEITPEVREDSEWVRNNSEEINALDKERALFVQLHYHFLPHWRLYRMLSAADGEEEVYATWCAFITCCQALGHGDIVWIKIQAKDITGALDYLRSGILPNKEAFLGHLASLFGLSPIKVIDFVWEVPRQVRLGDILHLCRLHSKPWLQVISRYLTLRIGSSPSHSRMELLKQMCSTQATKLAVLECLLHLLTTFLSSPSASVSAVTGDVHLKASVDTSRLSPEITSKTLECALTLVKDEELSAALDICWKYSYWSGYLKLLKQGDQWQMALQLEVFLDDISLLNGQNKSGFVPRNIQEWKYLLNVYKQAHSPVHFSSGETDLAPTVMAQTTSKVSSSSTSAREVASALYSSSASSGAGQRAVYERDTEFQYARLVRSGMESADESSAQQHQVTDSEKAGEEPDDDAAHSSKLGLSWMAVGLLVAQHLGASNAVQLLQSFCEEQATGNGDLLSPQFYTTCLTLAAAQRRQRLVLHNMLEKVDSYLWAKKTGHLSPQVFYAAMEEKSALSSGSSDSHNYHNLFTRLSAESVSQKPLAEDPDCHWGVKVNILQKCKVCQVQVTETVSHLEPGVFSFKCGHVFHKFCAPGKHCPLC